MADSAELENATFCQLLGCNPADLYYKLYQNMAGTMSDAIDALQSNLLEEFSDEPSTCAEIKERCLEMQQDLVHKKCRHYAEQLESYCRRNIFRIPRYVPVHSVDIDDEQHRDQGEDVPRLLAIASKLVDNIKVVDNAIEERKKVLAQVKQAKKLHELLSQHTQIGNDLLKDINVQKSLSADS